MARLPLLSLLAIVALSLSAHCSVLPAVNSVQEKWEEVRDELADMDANDPIADVDDMFGETDVADAFDKIDDILGDDLGETEDANGESVVDDTFDEVEDVMDELSNDTDDENAEADEMTDFPLDDLDDDALEALMDVEDDIFEGQAGVHVAKKMYLEIDSLYSKGGLRRRKRIAPLVVGAGRIAFSVGRSLLRSFSRGRVTRSGSRVTRQYHRQGNYGDAVRDFNRLRPDNVRSFQNGRISGQTGTMGNHRVTVRNGSSGNSRPTLEVRSHGGDMVRKFRYEK